MKAYKESETHYYKYEYSTFTQPVLTSNTSNLNFVVSGTNGDSNWRVFDNNESTGYSRYSSRERPDFTSNIILSTPTCFTGFTVKQRKDGDDNHSGHYFILYGSNDGTNYTQLVSTGVQGANTYTTSFTNTNYYSFYRFYASPLGGYDEDEIDIRDVSFVGEQRTVTKGTAEDYDYAIEGGKTYVVKEENVRKYYKLLPWTQPVLTSDSSYGSLTASFEDPSVFAYTISDNNSDTWWQETTYHTTGFINWRLPVTLKITAISITSRPGDRPNLTCRVYTDSAKTTPIGDSITTTTAKETKVVQNIPSEGVLTNNLYFDCSSTQDYLGISEVTITATKVVESTAEDYDFYEDVDVYKALKTYEKGQYYGN